MTGAMKVFLQQLFDYNYYCNKQFIAQCKGLEEVPGHSQKLFSHILNAHHLWNARIEGAAPVFGPWEVHDLSRWEDLHEENQRFTFNVLNETENLMRRVDYESTEGRPYTNTLQDILFHIINHSTHHRAQIAADFRSQGIEPLVFDYITYKR